MPDSRDVYWYPPIFDSVGVTDRLTLIDDDCCRLIVGSSFSIADYSLPVHVSLLSIYRSAYV